MGVDGLIDEHFASLEPALNEIKKNTMKAFRADEERGNSETSLAEGNNIDIKLLLKNQAIKEGNLILFERAIIMTEDECWAYVNNNKH